MTANKQFPVHSGKVRLPPPFVVLTSNLRLVCRETGALCRRRHCLQSPRVAWAGCGHGGEECSDQPGLRLERNDKNEQDKYRVLCFNTKGEISSIFIGPPPTLQRSHWSRTPEC